MKTIDKQYAFKCINCPFYSGIQCHGHGDYWGTCLLLEQWHRSIKRILPDSVYSGEGMNTILDDDSVCLLQRYGLVYVDDFRVKKK